jgi:hypothetical protein
MYGKRAQPHVSLCSQGPGRDVSSGVRATLSHPAGYYSITTPPQQNKQSRLCCL